jgi:hypothetical protein
LENKGSWKANASYKIDILTQADAHIGMCVELASYF